MKLEEIKKIAQDLEMFGADGLGDGSKAVSLGQAMLNLLKSGPWTLIADERCPENVTGFILPDKHLWMVNMNKSLTPIERFEALLGGKKIRVATWFNKFAYIEFKYPHGIVCEDSDVRNDFMGMLGSEDFQWEIYEEPKPEINLTPDDVGKRVKLRNGDITVVTSWRSESNTFCVDSYGFSYHTNGKNADKEDFNIIEVLP